MTRKLKMTASLFLVVQFTAFSTALAQRNQNTKRPQDQQQRHNRQPGRGGPMNFTVDLINDPILKTIRAAVEPTEQQMQLITDLYTTLRADQAEVIQKVRTEFRPQDGQRGQRGQGNQGDARGARGEGQRGGDARGQSGNRGQRGQDKNNDQRKAMMEKVKTEFDQLGSTFLADSRLLLNEDQYDAWDACAAGLELNPMNNRGRHTSGGPAVGEKAPSFNIINTNGEVVELATLLDKPTVIEFASYTCPIFRGKVDDMAALREEFGDTINYIIIYTKEAHASDGRRPVKRNADQGIVIPQHTSFADRQSSAQRMTADLKLDIPVFIDSFDNAVTDAYRGNPNRGYVIDTNGVIQSRQVWIEAEPTRAALLSLLKDQISTTAQVVK